MQEVSKAYKEYLKEDFLNTTWESFITLGAINQLAQSSAQLSKDSNIIHYSNVDIFDNEIESVKYASYERDRTLVDGSFSFLPDSDFKWTGVTSSQVSDEQGYIECIITIRNSSGVPISIKGVTMVFSDVWPIEFDIIGSNDEIILSEVDNDETIYQNNFVYEMKGALKIHIKKLNKPYYRFRLINFKFGLSVNFISDQIMSVSFAEQLQLISTEMYASDLSFTIDNQDLRYDIENPSSEVNFLEQAQKIQAFVSLPLPSGAVEKILLGTMYLSDWSAKLNEATFKATDIFNFMDGTYDKGKYYPMGITLYDLALDVLSDAGFDQDDYLLDVYLKTIKVYNPMPVVTHKEALQMIANAGRCILKQDRLGRILIKSSFIPDTSLSSADKEPHANLISIIDGNAKDIYASYELDLTTVDQSRYFLPDNVNSLNTGYISKTLSNRDCTYSDKPHILIDFEASANLFSFNMVFGPAICSDFVITTYMYDTVVESLAYTGNTDKEFRIDYPFKECNRILITFMKAINPYQRAYVDSISFDTVTDKHITLDDITSETLEGTKLETVKTLHLVRTIYTPKAETEIIDVRVTKAAGDVKETVVNLSEPMYELDLQLEGKSVGYDRSAWSVKVDLEPPSTGSKQYVLQAIGHKLNKTTQTMIVNINPTGVVKTMENPLISDDKLANDVADWVASYLKSDREYNFSYLHGDPALDTNDIIHQENAYIDDLQTQIYAHELSIAGAITGKIKARKVIR